MKERWKQLDRAVYSVERLLVVSCLIVMSVVVFLDVVHRTFAGEQNKMVDVLVMLAGYAGQKIERGSETYTSLETGAPYVMWPAFVALAFWGIWSAKREKKISLPIAIGSAVVGTVGCYGLIRLFIHFVPNGIIWSQQFALMLTLWVGFIGASMSTHEGKHLKVEAAQKLIPLRFRPYAVALSHLATALVCIGLGWLSLRFVSGERDIYTSTEGLGGVIQEVGFPLYVGFMALPISFGLMALRYIALAGLALSGEFEEPDATAALLAEHRVAGDTGLQQSEVPTEAMGIEHGLARPRSGDPLPSDVETEAIPAERLDDDKGGGR